MTWLGLVRYHVLFAIDIMSSKAEIIVTAAIPVAPAWSSWRAIGSMPSMPSCSVAEEPLPTQPTERQRLPRMFLAQVVGVEEDSAQVTVQPRSSSFQGSGTSPSLRFFSTLLLAASTCVLASCSDSAENHLRFLVDVRTDWTIPAASAEELGYSISVEVRPIYQNSKCPDIPSTTRILVNGAAVALSPNTWTACMEAKVQLGPFMQDQTITVNVEEAGNITAEAVYDGLTPGTAATIVPPLSGPLHPGEEIVIRPIPELPSSSGTAVFYPLDSDWHPYGINGTTSRLPDGLHVQSPAFSGNAIVAVWNGDFALPKFTCLGFNTCEGSAATVLGPFFVVGAP